METNGITETARWNRGATPVVFFSFFLFSEAAVLSLKSQTEVIVREGGRYMYSIRLPDAPYKSTRDCPGTSDLEGQRRQPTRFPA